MAAWRVLWLLAVDRGCSWRLWLAAAVWMAAVRGCMCCPGTTRRHHRHPHHGPTYV